MGFCRKPLVTVEQGWYDPSEREAVRVVENGKIRTSREEFPEGWKKWPVIGGQRYIWVHKYSRHYRCGVHYLRPVLGGPSVGTIVPVITDSGVVSYYFAQFKRHSKIAFGDLVPAGVYIERTVQDLL